MARLVVVQQKSHTALDVCGDRGFVGKLAGGQQGAELKIGLDHAKKLPGGMGAGFGAGELPAVVKALKVEQ